MKRKQIQVEVNRRLSAGEGKTAVFQNLVSQGAKERITAHFIASHADPKRLQQHTKLIDAMIVISWLQMALAVLLGLGVGLKDGLGAGLFMTAFVGGIVYLFVWGFTNNKAWAYNVTIFLSIINLPKALTGFAAQPTGSVIGLALSVGLISFTWYVRSKLFPDFGFVTPKKVRGAFVFSD